MSKFLVQKKQAVNIVEMTDDTPQQSSNRIESAKSNDAVQDFDLQNVLKKHWEEMKSTLPSFYANIRKGNLDRKVWPSWKFNTPDPFLAGSGTPNAYELCLGSVEVYVWCPHTFWPQYLSDFVLKCVQCGSTNDVLLDGWSDSFRKVTGLTHTSYIISRRYKHMNCPVAAEKGRKATVFNSCNADFIASLPEIVQLQFELSVGKKSAYKNVYAREMKQCTSFKSAESVHRALINSKKLLQEKRYLMHMVFLRGRGRLSSFLQSNNTPPPDLPPIENAQFATAKRLRKMAVKELQQQEKYMNMSMRKLTGIPYISFSFIFFTSATFM